MSHLVFANAFPQFALTELIANNCIFSWIFIVRNSRSQPALAVKYIILKQTRRNFCRIPILRAELFRRTKDAFYVCSGSLCTNSNVFPTNKFRTQDRHLSVDLSKNSASIFVLLKELRRSATITANEPTRMQVGVLSLSVWPGYK